MSFSMYQAFIPVAVRYLQNLASLLEKGRADAVARKIEPAVFLASRLAPDMYPLSRQIQIASDIVKGGAGRLAGMEAPSFPDTETNFDELQDRIAKTVAFLQTVTEAHMEGSETKPVTLKFPNGEMNFSGVDYLTMFVLPNLYFHITTAYLILRHNGVAIGKRDFMGA